MRIRGSAAAAAATFAVGSLAAAAAVFAPISDRTHAAGMVAGFVLFGIAGATVAIVRDRVRLPHLAMIALTVDFAGAAVIASGGGDAIPVVSAMMLREFFGLGRLDAWMLEADFQLAGHEPVVLIATAWLMIWGAALSLACAVLALPSDRFAALRRLTVGSIVAAAALSAAAFPTPVDGIGPTLMRGMLATAALAGFGTISCVLAAIGSHRRELGRSEPSAIDCSCPRCGAERLPWSES